MSLDIGIRYNASELGLQMVAAVKQWASIADESETIHAGILDIVNRGGTDRDFYKWTQENLRSGFDKRWSSLLFTSVALATYSEHHRSTLLTSNPDTFPYRTIFVMTQACKEHQPLDGLVRRFDDPIWEFISPLNGWMCGCTVSPLMDDEPEVESGLEKMVDKKIIESCSVSKWLHQFPTEQLKLV